MARDVLSPENRSQGPLFLAIGGSSLLAAYLLGRRQGRRLDRDELEELEIRLSSLEVIREGEAATREAGSSRAESESTAE